MTYSRDNGTPDIGSERARRGRGPVTAVPPVPPEQGAALSADADGLRDQAIEVVREQLRGGRYRPPADAVAEQLVAWLFADDVAAAS